ncbi:MAG: hypothetical protein KAG97_03705, partial [Victivallales bacterium]|nr:hypothetical protein [Victivallales bacterium]
MKLLFRGGAAWGLLVLASGFAVFIFFSAGGGDSLVDELRIRIEYALYASTTLLNLALIYFACVSLRKEIDERRFHTISAAPVRRVEIWLGKFLGVSTMGLIAFLAISIALVFSCAFLIVGWSKPEHVRELDSKFFRTYYKCQPDLADLEKRVAKNYKKSLAEMKKRKAAEHEEHEGEEDGHHAHHHHGEWEGDEWRSRKHLLADIRKGKQIISPGATSQWRFRWSPKDNQGEYVLLRFKFYTNRKRRKSEGVWSVLNENNDVAWSGKFKGYSFVEHELRIPSKFMPKTSEFT